jgi:2-polyprenyl-3-methyl-5-hydroxy-6-metoxy-1,4-benzoquinol methylase
MDAQELIAFVEQYEIQKYQTIELAGKIIRPGTEQCWKSWENICKFDINWLDKFVCDVGCYFGYFSIQVLKSGVKKVLGIDQNEALLSVYKKILSSNGFKNIETLVSLLGNGNVIPNHNYDIVLALNMLHHVRSGTTEEEYIKVLKSIFTATKEVLFEVNDNQLMQIKNTASENNFVLKKTIKSHRNTAVGQRYLLHFLQKEQLRS